MSCKFAIGTMKIRPYKSEDQEQVVQLWVSCGLVKPQNNPVRDIERKLRVNPEWFLVGVEDDADTGERLIATCMAGYEGHRGWINYLAVGPMQQRRGLATQIMDEAERLLREAGCAKINLQVRSTNQHVIDFYKSIGYAIDDVVSMGKRLEFDISP
jgi:ribosomal protein S18 acetylase RimI-like enzyme